jgi:hypothetical protein
MKDTLVKVLPIVFGVAVGWMLLNPPAILEPIGPIRYLLVAVLAFGLVVAFVGAVISSNLPEDVVLTPLDKTPDPSLTALGQRIAAMGFEPVGGLYRVEMSPAATMLAYVHPRVPVYAAVYRTGTVPAVTSFDFVSILHGDRAGLTSGADPRGATLPGGPGTLRQVFPKASAEDVAARHREALDHLEALGLPARAVSAETFIADFKMSMRRQREAFFAAPISSTVIAIWRSATSSTPHIGRLQDQAVARTQIQGLVTGRRS